MKYLLLMYADEAEIPQSSEEVKTMAPVWYQLAEDMKAAGVWLASSGLSPVATATTVRVRDGKTLVTDGPFAETHEQLGGFLLLECGDIDEALAWAARIPTATYGSVEIRPQWGQ